MALEKTLECPLDSKEIQPVNSKGNESWIFIGRTDAEAETPILWPPDVKNWLIGKDPAGKDWRHEEKGTKEDEMVGWHHWLNGHEFEQILGDSDGAGKPGVLHSPWGRKESDTTERLHFHYPTISFSLSSPFPPALSLSQHQGLFQWVGSSHQVAKVLEVHFSPSMNIQGWFPLELTSLISMQSKGLSRVFSSSTIWKHQFFGTQPSYWYNSHIHTGLLEKP